MPEPTDISPVVKPATPVDNQPAKVQADVQPKRRAFWRRRGVWIIAALLIVGVTLFGYHWAFGKAKVHYTTAAVTRGDVESTVVAAGIVQHCRDDEWFHSTRAFAELFATADAHEGLAAFVEKREPRFIGR